MVHDEQIHVEEKDGIHTLGRCRCRSPPMPARVVELGQCRKEERSPSNGVGELARFTATAICDGIS